MRKTLLFLFFCTLISVSSAGEAITSRTVEQLSHLCKVWGFLKYYSPDVARKKVDWDAILMESYPAFQEELDKESYNNLLREFIYSAYPKGNHPAAYEKSTFALVKDGNWRKLAQLKSSKKDLDFRVDFEWFFDAVFDERTSGILVAILCEYKAVNSKYLSGKYAIKHKEKDFLELDSLNSSLYFLAMCRHWNAINYFFPYKYLADKNWDDVLIETIPKIVQADGYWSYKKAMMMMNHEVKDSHAIMFPTDNKYVPKDSTKKAFGKVGVPPYLFRIIDEEIFVDRILDSSAGLQTGDQLLSFLGHSVDSTKARIERYGSVSTHQAYLADVMQTYNYTYSDTFSYSVLRGQDTINLKEGLSISPEVKNSVLYRSEPYWYEIDESLGYIDLDGIRTFSFLHAMKKLRKKETIIFDMRGYPRSIGPVFLPYLLKKQKSNVACFQYGNKDFPGTFIHAKQMNYRHPYFRALIPFARRFKGKVAVLINSTAISYSETTAMIFQASGNELTFYGEATKGANGNVVTVVLPGGFKVWYSSLDWHYPDESQLQRKGVRPDVEIQYNIEDLGKQEDVVLQKLIELLGSNKSACLD